MRNIAEVIEEAVKVEGVPESLKKNLLHILKEKVAYCPPEQMGLMWHESQIYINGHMPKDPKNLLRWQKNFLKVWTGKDWQ